MEEEELPDSNTEVLFCDPRRHLALAPKELPRDPRDQPCPYHPNRDEEGVETETAI